MKKCPQCSRVYNDDTFDYCLDDGRLLVYGPGDSDPATAILDTPPSESPTRIQTSELTETPTTLERRRIKRWILILSAVVLVGAGLFVYRMYLSGGSVLSSAVLFSKTVPIKSLAVLPLKPLDATDNYIGMGIADAIIRRISQTGQLTVRPTSAIRRYLNDDTDALTAAKQLNTDAVLEGSVQRAADRLRVSVNLLRTSDGSSLWNDSIDVKMSDIFAVQDTVSQQVATRLSLRLDPSQQAALTKRYTSNPTAYEYYQKAIYIFDSRFEDDKAKSDATIDLLKKAIEADPDYALAHAQLAYAYAEMATFGEPTNPSWEKLYEQEIERATQLDPQLAETHLAKFLILWSEYSGYQTRAAIREIIEAQRLNPSVGHAELGALYSHVGLMEQSARELQRASEIDPTSDFVKNQIINQYWLVGDYDGWVAESHRQYGAADHPEDSMWYLMGKRRLDDLQKRIEELQTKHVDTPELRSYKSILSALRGDYKSAEDQIPGILSSLPIQHPGYHHATFNVACIYAIEGKAADAVKWLRKTAEAGYPCYQRFERDTFFDRIRQSPEFIRFMSDMKNEYESYQTEFGDK